MNTYVNFIFMQCFFWFLYFRIIFQVLDAIICYSSLPYSCLQNVIMTLCRTLNLKEFCEPSWKLMRNLLGTHLGHASIVILCFILKDETMKEYSMLRSAISFVGMGLWGPRYVPSLMYKPQSILSSFKSALSTGSPMLGFEITLTCHRLVKKFGHELHACAWDEMLKIIHLLFVIINNDPNKEQVMSLKQNVHELLTIIEKLYQSQAFNGSSDELFQLIEANIKSRPFESLLLLITHRAQAINPAKINWINNLVDFVDKYYVSSNNSKARLKVLDILANVITSNIDVYEKELVDNVLFPKFQNIFQEPCYAVKEYVISFLLNLCFHCKTDQGIVLLQILEPFSKIDSDLDLDNHQLLSCIQCATTGFVDVFKQKFYSKNSIYSVKCFCLMIDFIESYYGNNELCKQPNIFRNVRLEIFKIFLDLRIDVKLKVVLLSKSGIESNISCSCYQELEQEDCLKLSVNSSKSSSTEYLLPLQRSFSNFSLCFSKENYWPILEVAIEGLCKMLNNKCLILVIDPREIDKLAESLTLLISNSNRIHTLTAAPITFKRSDLMSCSLKVIPVLASYHEQMSIPRQRQILRCLEAGFNSRCAKSCITATTLCVVEMKPEALLRNLPSILLRLSQMSATVPLATAVLGLLSTLAQIPELYSNFVDDQYMSAFKIALQHADPDKFSLYVVSLAHHVITMWFIKCRLAFRPDFVRYITLSLQNTCRDCASDSLQHNLIESCIDVMARYTFANVVPDPRRLDKQKSLSRHGRCATWVLGNRLITIRTDILLEKKNTKKCTSISGPGEDALVVGLSLDDFAICADKKVSSEANFESSDRASIKSTRQRHQSSGAVLRQSINSSSSSCTNFSGSHSDNGFKTRLSSVDNMNSGWAEIHIRRPSGSSLWFINSHKFNLGLNTLTKPENHILGHPLSVSASDLRWNEQNDDVSFALGTSHHVAAVSRQRSRTVSSSQDYVMAAAKAKAKVAHVLSNETVPCDLPEDGHTLSPEFIFLQLFHSPIAGDGIQRPLLLPDSATIERSVSNLDLIPPYNTWGAGVVYVRPGQSDDCKKILRNRYGSLRFQNFLSSLGGLVWLADCDPAAIYLGGLDDVDGEDGDMTYVWQENVMQMVFHVATLMPNHESDVSNKLRHIGNDYVTIVYDDNPTPNYIPGSVVKGQFLSIEIVVSPLEFGYNIVKLVYHKSELKSVLQVEDQYTVSDSKLALLVRQLALHASMASAAQHLKFPEKFVSKALSRLKQIKHIRSRALQEVAWKDEDKAERYGGSRLPELYSLEGFSDFVC